MSDRVSIGGRDFFKDLSSQLGELPGCPCNNSFPVRFPSYKEVQERVLELHRTEAKLQTSGDK